MARKEKTAPPPRKEPGLVGRVYSGVVGFVCGLIMALVVSILIEWTGIAWCWPEQGHRHAKAMLAQEKHYLDQRVIPQGRSLAQTIHQTTLQVSAWIDHTFGTLPWIKNSLRSKDSSKSRFRTALHHLYYRYREYLLAVPLISQLFIVRLAILVFSLPAFIMAAIVGMVDGLVGWDLRRWGGGRGSSNWYNIARKSIYPVLMLACMIYISLPITLHPSLIVTPFTVVFSMAVVVTMTFSRLKKYF